MSKPIAAIEDVVNVQESGPLSRLLRSQAFWITVFVLLIALLLMLRTDRFWTPNNLFNVARNLSFVGIMALG